jgi:hypothetical protein
VAGPSRQPRHSSAGCANGFVGREGRKPARRSTITATQKLHDIGQNLCLGNITRGLLTSGTLRRYRDGFAVTGLTSNPTFRLRSCSWHSPLTDLRRAVDLFRPVHDRTNGVDSWVSLEFSPLLAYDIVSGASALPRGHPASSSPRRGRGEADGIRVNAVAPGTVNTPLHQNTSNEVMESLSPMGQP